MRALRDFNIPKIVSDDVPIFMGLIGDLFPALNVPRKRDLEFEKEIRQAIIDQKLQPEENFILKVCKCSILFSNSVCCISGVMGSTITSSTTNFGFEPRSGQTKDHKIGICCFSARHAALRRKSKDWLAWNQDNVSEWSDMFIRRLLFQ
jgi:hypothetical protein